MGVDDSETDSLEGAVNKGELRRTIYADRTSRSKENNMQATNAN